jgi:hypothetical protein
VLDRIESGVISIDLTVVDALESTYGKYPAQLGKIIVVEKAFLEALTEYFNYVTTGEVRALNLNVPV